MCGQDKDEKKAQYLRAIFDGIPVPTFIVDADVRIQDFNTAAEQFLGPDPAIALYLRGGEALHCIHAEKAGCGKAKVCGGCVIRKSVTRAMAGKVASRQLHQVEWRSSHGTTAVDLLVTASLLPYTEPPRALLILEDIREIIRKHGRGQVPARRRSTGRRP